MTHAIFIANVDTMGNKISIYTVQSQPGIPFQQVEMITCLNATAIINQVLLIKFKFAF